MAKQYPKEFREDVVRVAQRREAPIAQIARVTGLSRPTIYRVLRELVPTIG